MESKSLSKPRDNVLLSAGLVTISATLFASRRVLSVSQVFPDITSVSPIMIVGDFAISSTAFRTTRPLALHTIDIPHFIIPQIPRSVKMVFVLLFPASYGVSYFVSISLICCVKLISRIFDRIFPMSDGSEVIFTKNSGNSKSVSTTHLLKFDTSLSLGSFHTISPLQPNTR